MNFRISSFFLTHTCQLLESWSRDTWDVRWFGIWSRSPCFSRGSGDVLPGKFWKWRLSNQHFLIFWSMILHINCKKNKPKIYTKFLVFRGKWQENELFNQNNALIIPIPLPQHQHTFLSETTFRPGLPWSSSGRNEQNEKCAGAEGEELVL